MHLTRISEDYLEAIYLLIQEKGYARPKDIAQHLGVKSPSVTDMVKRLTDEGLAVYERYGMVTLTPKGEEIARDMKTRHDTIAKMLRILLVPDEIARRDACEIEHNLDHVTIEQFRNFVRFMECLPEEPRWVQNFKEYCRTGVAPKCKRLKG
ncbi:MAG: metal-dependent transcriptional regulator [Methanopyri archaeon]|jgi:DtxR family Mn-dependent transcriptional regulator|nr:metal-dependent transcriptional regulator [Methanopyri archaeon]